MDVNVNLLQALLNWQFSSAGGRNLSSFLAIHFHSPFQMFMSLGLNVKSIVCETALRVSRKKTQTNKNELRERKTIFGWSYNEK